MAERTLDDLQRALAAGDLAEARHALLSLREAEEELLEQELGSELLLRVKRQARRVSRGAERGRVIVVHGIMGSLLDVVDARGDSDRVWANVLRLANGRIADLELADDGQPKRRNLRVQTAGLHRKTYLALLLELDREWEVLPFAYDWREDIARSADQLAGEIARFGSGRPVHLVAHSMGGLVSRCMILRHPELWQRMADPNGLASGGRLVMLGTPNHGSFAIPLMLCGEEFLVRVLAGIDRKHSTRELLEILSSFPGAYQMLPSPHVELDDDHAELYDATRWGKLSVKPGLLQRAAEFHGQLREVVDPQRFVSVAGYDQETPVAIRIAAPGKFAFRRTRDGDGRVPHALSRLQGVRTLWIDEVHGDLPRNERVLGGIHDLLASGTTTELAAERPVRRRAGAEATWLAAADVDERPDPRALAAQRGGELAPAQQREAERLLLGDYAGGRRALVKRKREAPAAARPLPELAIEVVWGSLTEVDGDAYAVGHYEGVLPQNAELALDRVVSPSPERLVITEHTRRGTLRGALGDVNYFKWAAPEHGQRVVAVAGMGRPGAFGVGSLRRLVRELVIALSTLPNVRTVCCVLIGSGTGTLSTSDAVLGLVDGISEALTQGAFVGQIRKLRIVEQSWSKAKQIQQELGRRLPDLASVLAVPPPALVEGEGGGVSDEEAIQAWLASARRARRPGAPKALRNAVELMLGELAPAARARLEAKLAARPGAEPSPERPLVPTRVSAARDGAVIRVAAITESTTVAERATSFDLARVNEIAARINDPSADLQPGWPSLLLQLLLPRDFRSHIEAARALVFEVDRYTARIHWELVAQRLASGFARDETNLRSALALQLPIARQLRTTYSPPPTKPADSSARTLRALVIGDPGAGAHGLPGARREALAVKRFLERARLEVRALIGAPSDRAGLPADCESASWLATMEALTEPWDILHYCGHGDFDPQDPSRVGWVFENGLLTAGDIRHLDGAPGLVVANACLSARTSEASALSGGGAAAPRGDREAGLLPSLADEFFKLGVRNYLGASWEVEDLGAVRFAESFYAGVLGGRSIGEALLDARKLLWNERRHHGKLWAAYQHYGDPAASLSRPAAQRPPSAAARSRAKPRERRALKK